MATYQIQSETLTDIADSIREKTGSEEAIATTSMSSMIRSIYSLLTVDDIYPVGSVYMSFDSTSPASLFGGTWEQITQRFLFAAHDGGGFPSGATGGEAAHTLTKDELPNFKADVYITTGGVNYQVMYTNAASRANGQSPYFVVNSGSTKVWADIDGGNVAHNNMPPYLAVYMWCRIA